MCADRSSGFRHMLMDRRTERRVDHNTQQWAAISGGLMASQITTSTAYLICFVFRTKRDAGNYRNFGRSSGHLLGTQEIRLFKNLSAEYQKVRQQLHVSGNESDSPPCCIHLLNSLRVTTSIISCFTLRVGALCPR